MKAFDKITVFLSRAVDLLCFLGYAVALVVMLVQILARYLFQYGIVWTDEFSRYIMVWLVLLCSATLVREKGHIRMTVLESFFPEKWRKWFDFAIHLFIIIFSVVVFRYSLVTLHFSARAVSSNMRIPMTWIYSSFTVSMFIMALNAIFNALLILLQRDKSKISKDEVIE